MTEAENIDWLEKRLTGCGQDAFISVFIPLHTILNDFVRKQTKEQLALVFTFQTLVERTECQDGEAADILIQHLCAEYADKFRIDEKATSADMDDSYPELDYEGLLDTEIKEEPEDTPAVTDEPVISPGKRKHKPTTGGSKAKKRKKSLPEKEVESILDHDDTDYDDVTTACDDAVDDYEQAYSEVKVKTTKQRKKSSSRKKKKKSAVNDESEAGQGDMAKTLEKSEDDESFVHDQSVTSQDEDKCPLCDNSFTRMDMPDHLEQTHQLTRHQPKEYEAGDMWLDEQGQVVYSTVKPRSAVLKSNLKRSEYLCSICGKSFKRSFSGKEHMAVAHGLGLYKCPVCDKTFLRENYFNDHVDGHNGIKRHRCEVCQVNFTFRCSLRRHAKYCSGKKEPSESQLTGKFECPHCGRRFVRSSGLTEHIKGKHSAAKTYNCACGKSYTWRMSFWKHRRNCGSYLAKEFRSLAANTVDFC